MPLKGRLWRTNRTNLTWPTNFANHPFYRDLTAQQRLRMLLRLRRKYCRERCQELYRQRCLNQCSNPPEQENREEHFATGVTGAYQCKYLTIGNQVLTRGWENTARDQHDGSSPKFTAWIDNEPRECHFAPAGPGESTGKYTGCYELVYVPVTFPGWEATAQNQHNKSSTVFDAEFLDKFGNPVPAKCQYTSSTGSMTERQIPEDHY